MLILILFSINTLINIIDVRVSIETKYTNEYQLQLYSLCFKEEIWAIK